MCVVPAVEEQQHAFPVKYAVRGCAKELRIKIEWVAVKNAIIPSPHLPFSSCPPCSSLLFQRPRADCGVRKHAVLLAHVYVFPAAVNRVWL